MWEKIGFAIGIAGLVAIPLGWLWNAAWNSLAEKIKGAEEGLDNLKNDLTQVEREAKAGRRQIRQDLGTELKEHRNDVKNIDNEGVARDAKTRGLIKKLNDHVNDTFVRHHELQRIEDRIGSLDKKIDDLPERMFNMMQRGRHD